MPETLDDAKRKEKREREEHQGVEDLESIEKGLEESPADFEGEALEEFIKGFDRWVTEAPEVEDGFQDTIGGINSDARRLRAFLDEIQIGIEQDEIQNLDQRQLFITLIDQIANTTNPLLNNIAQHLNTLTVAQTASLSTAGDIESLLQPFSTITISGEEEIDNANSPERVVPVGTTTRLVFIRAATTNQEPIAFGDDDISPGSGFILKPGESINLGIDLNTRPLFMASEEGGAIIQILGMV